MYITMRPIKDSPPYWLFVSSCCLLADWCINLYLCHIPPPQHHHITHTYVTMQMYIHTGTDTHMFTPKHKPTCMYMHTHTSVHPTTTSSMHTLLTLPCTYHTCKHEHKCLQHKTLCRYLRTNMMYSMSCIQYIHSNWWHVCWCCRDSQKTSCLDGMIFWHRKLLYCLLVDKTPLDSSCDWPESFFWMEGSVIRSEQSFCKTECLSIDMMSLLHFAFKYLTPVVQSSERECVN